MNKYRAFTLVELLVVIAIITTIAGIALPLYSRMFRGVHLTNASRLITQALSAARQMAVTQQVYSFTDDDGTEIKGERSRYVEFDIPGNRLRTYFWTRKNSQRYKQITVGEWEALPQTIEFYASDTYKWYGPNNKSDYYKHPPEYIRFKPNGTAFSSESPDSLTVFDFAIVDTNSGEGAKSKTRVVTVQGVTGMARSETK